MINQSSWLISDICWQQHVVPWKCQKCVSIKMRLSTGFYKGVVLFYTLFSFMILYVPYIFCTFYISVDCASSQADVVLPVGKGYRTPRSQSDHMWRRHEAAPPGPAAGHRWGGNRPPESSRCCPELLPPQLLGGRSTVSLHAVIRSETRIPTFYDTTFHSS